MTYRIDASMHAVQAARDHASSQCVFADTRAAKLINLYHPVLPLGDLRDQHVGLGDFPAHYGG